MSFVEILSDSSGKVACSVGFFGRLRCAIAIVAILLALCAVLAPVAGKHVQPACGKRQTNDTIVNGPAKTQSDWPWHAAIYLSDQNQRTYICGGSIIGISTILTGAHCLFQFNRLIPEIHLSVHVGWEHLNETSHSVQVMGVSKLIIHPEFNVRLGMAHDIAIVKLSTEIVMSPFVQPVCLCSVDDGCGQLDGLNGTVVGFGKHDHDQVRGRLQQATLPVVDFDACLERDRAFYGRFLTRDLYCAGGLPNVSGCPGAAGGGMFFELDGTWYVRGIVSLVPDGSDGNPCDSSKHTVVTDVARYADFIVHFASTPRPLAQLEPCGDGPVRRNSRCNMASQFDRGFLLVGGLHNITRIPLTGERSVPVAEAFKAKGIDRDCANGRFYWSDDRTPRLLSAKYDGTDRQPFITKDIVRPAGVAVDWISRRLYWADRTKRTIEVASLDDPDVRTVLIHRNLTDPIELAVDPWAGKLYWMDWNDSLQKIEWSNLNGSARQLLVGSPRVQVPISIGVCPLTGELCYVDLGTRRIECIDPYSRKIRTMVNQLYLPFGLAVTNELFYWSDLQRGEIHSIGTGGVYRKLLVPSPEHGYELFSMAAVTDNCPLFHSPCASSNGRCKKNSICLVNSSLPSGKSCLVQKKCKSAHNCSNVVKEDEG